MFPLKDSQPSGAFPLITILIIISCAAVLFLQITTSDPDLFINTWALVPSKVSLLNISTWLPFLTSMFMHGGLMHFASNMWYLWIFGDNVEGALGKIKFVLFYIAAGLFASLAQYLLVIDSSIPNLGASGAIAGVLGFYLVNFNKSTVKTLIPYPYLTVTELPSTFILTTWFLLQLLSGAASLPFSGDSGGVAWWAHIGGFVFGYLVGQVYKRTRRIQEVTPFERFVRF